MKEKVSNKLEKNVAEILMIAILMVILLSSCGTTGNCGGKANAWSASNNCPAYR